MYHGDDDAQDHHGTLEKERQKIKRQGEKLETPYKKEGKKNDLRRAPCFWKFWLFSEQRRLQ